MEQRNWRLGSTRATALLSCRASLTGLITKGEANSCAAFFDRQQDFGNRFGARFRAEVAFTVDPDTYCICVHVAFPDHEHGVDFHLFGALDFAVDLVGAFVDFRADLMSAQFV